jgi:hypothetical protein
MKFYDLPEFLKDMIFLIIKLHPSGEPEASIGCVAKRSK